MEMYENVWNTYVCARLCENSLDCERMCEICAIMCEICARMYTFSHILIHSRTSSYIYQTFPHILAHILDVLTHSHTYLTHIPHTPHTFAHIERCTHRIYSHTYPTHISHNLTQCKETKGSRAKYQSLQGNAKVNRRV